MIIKNRQKAHSVPEKPIAKEKGPAITVPIVADQEQRINFVISHSGPYSTNTALPEFLRLLGKVHFSAGLLQITQPTEIDKIVKAIILLEGILGSPIDLLKHWISLEINETQTVNTLMRANSIATKLLTAYVKRIGQSFLKNVIAPQVQITLSQKVNVEVDPNKDPNAKKNIEKLKSVVEQYLHTIMDSIQLLPPEIREICSFIKTEVDKKFPGNGLPMVGGFVFLRFICPSIVTPDGHKIINETIPSDARRPLVLISKVIQNISNEVDVKKEEFMADMSDFVLESREDMQRFFQKLSTLPATYPKNLPLELFKEEETHTLIYELHNQIVLNDKKLIAQVSTKPECGDLIGQLNNILSIIGQPNKPVPNKGPNGN